MRGEGRRLQSQMRLRRQLRRPAEADAVAEAEAEAETEVLEKKVTLARLRKCGVGCGCGSAEAAAEARGGPSSGRLLHAEDQAAAWLAREGADPRLRWARLAAAFCMSGAWLDLWCSEPNAGDLA